MPDNPQPNPDPTPAASVGALPATVIIQEAEQEPDDGVQR